MRFRTEYIPKKTELCLNPYKPVTFIGSCFAENISAKMNEHLWDAYNPLGTLYNPSSIANALRLCLLNNFPESEFEKSLFLEGEKYRSWFFDSRFSSFCAPDSMAAFRERRSILLDSLIKGRTLVVTFGTAWVYMTQGRIVGNCHKQKSEIFERKILSVDEILEDWKKLIPAIQKILPDIKFIFTVSPVRHLKDGFQGNSLSKSILRIAIENLCQSFKDCYYFPAYEILNDDLRDYRFYSSDLVHPSEDAIEYLWEKFCESFLDKKGLDRIKEGLDLNKALNHKPIPDASRLKPQEIIERETQRKEDLKKKFILFKKNDNN